MQPPGVPAHAPAHAPLSPSAPPCAAAHLQRQLEHFAETVSSPIAGVARALQDAARVLQSRCGGLGRVHVIFEPVAAAAPGPAALSVLFSPTVAFDTAARLQRRAHLADALRRFADDSAPPRAPAGAERVPPPPPPPPPRNVLAWYPGARAGTDKKTWLTERMHVKGETMARFKRLSRKQTEGVYQGLFARMFRIMKTRVPGERGPLKYARFTPPWLRKHIVTGTTTVILDTDTMPELRQQRNRMGERRLKALMSAFYEREALAKAVLDALLQEVVAWQPRPAPLPPAVPPHTPCPRVGPQATASPNDPAPATASAPAPTPARPHAPLLLPHARAPGSAPLPVSVPVLPQQARVMHRPVRQGPALAPAPMPAPPPGHVRISNAGSTPSFSRAPRPPIAPTPSLEMRPMQAPSPSPSLSMREQEFSSVPSQEGSGQPSESAPGTPPLPP